MLVDARELAPDAVLRADVCIIGSGPAGLTLARQLIDQHLRVYLFESGPAEFDPQAQELSEAETIGEPFLSPRVTRCRQFGGNSNIWAIKIGAGRFGVRYAPLDEIDFEQRPWVPHSGWPFGRAELDRYYERAQSVCDLGPFAYDAAAWEDPGASRLGFDPARVSTSMFQFGPRDVFHRYIRKQIERANNVTAFLNATAVELETNDSCQLVTAIKLKSAPDRQFTVRARQFVLAAGGMENCRLLLLSNRRQVAGLGNAHDVVGRYFMDHPLVDAGMFVPASRAQFDRMALYDLRRVRRTPVLGRLGISPERMRRDALLNTAIVMFPRPSLRRFEAVRAFKQVAGSLRARELDRGLPTLVTKMALGMDYLVFASYLAAIRRQSLLHGFGRGGWSELRNNQRRFSAFQLFFQTEQAPDADNRITLSRERDLLGSHKLQLDWRWRAIDRDSATRTQEVLAAAASEAGLGELQLKRDPEGKPDLCKPSGVAHHIGTTRMHDDPRRGVVDASCRVHQLANLFMAGSSVFPTGGCANPTLTIVALALRLAEHLQHTLRTSAQTVS